MISWFPVCMLWYAEKMLAAGFLYGGKRMKEKKKMRKITCLALAFLFFLLVWQELAAVSASVAAEEVDSVWKKTKNYILEINREPGYDSQWFALGLARSGMDINGSYFQTFYRNMASYITKKEGALHRVKYTEYSKSILSLTAIGKDARDVNGYNLLSYLADFSMVTRQGFNGPIWALLALNSNPAYTIPIRDDVEEQTTEKVLVDYLLAREVSDMDGNPLGGWSLNGDRADVDITAMTIQALAPYYHKAGYERVTEAIDRGLKVLSDMQAPSTDGFAFMGADNSESCAQVLVALCSLGIDPQKDSRFIKQGGGIVRNLLSYYKPERDVNGKERADRGGFMHVKPDGQNNGGGAPGEINGMATEQGFYALTAYKRLLDGKKPLYDMSDLSVSAGEAVDPGKNGGGQSQGGEDRKPTGGNSQNNKTDDKGSEGQDGGENTSGGSTKEEDKNPGSSTKGDENGSGTEGSGKKPSETKKKPSGKTKKYAGTVKTTGAKKNSGTKKSSGGTGGSGTDAGNGGGSEGDSGASQSSVVSEVSEASGIPESAAGSEAAEAADDAPAGWSFAGEAYVPESPAAPEDGEGPEAAPPDQSRSEQAAPYWLLVLGIMGGAVWYVGIQKRVR